MKTTSRIDNIYTALRGAATHSAQHNYTIDTATWVPACTCGWRATRPYAAYEFDAHLQTVAEEVAAPLMGTTREEGR